MSSKPKRNGPSCLTRLVCILAGCVVMAGVWFVLAPTLWQAVEELDLLDLQTQGSDTTQTLSDDTIDDVDLAEDPVEEVEPESTVVDVDLIPVEDTGYYFDQMSDTEKQLYYEFLLGLRDFTDSVDLTAYETMSMDAMFLVYQGVLLDHPEIFWYSTAASCSYIDADEGQLLRAVELYPLLEQAEVEAYNAQLELVCTAILTEMSDLTDPYDQALYLYEYLIDNCTYDQETADLVLGNEIKGTFYESNCMIGALLEGSAICTGYSRAYSYLLGQLSIEAFSVVGVGRAEGHEWNMISLEGDYYYVDVTWGDTSFTDGTAWTSYAYFATTSETILIDHTLDEDYTYPWCTATACNYYVHEGLLLDAYSYDACAAIVADAVQAGNQYVELKFTSDQAYVDAQTALLEAGDYFSLIKAHDDSLNQVFYYYLDEDETTITLVLDYK